VIVAGIGSRETPPNVLADMRAIGKIIIERGDMLRSGGAPGADQAFEWGATDNPGRMNQIDRQCEIFLPWASFEKDSRSWIVPRLLEPADWTFEVAAEYHPRWQWLKQGAKKLHARNVHQILGPTPDSPRTDLVVCWTKGAKGGGGTGQALRIAKAFYVDILDLASNEDYLEARAFFDI
jgi:hypothetical protein